MFFSIGILAELLAGGILGVSFFRFFRYLYVRGVSFVYALVATLLLLEITRLIVKLFSTVVLKQTIQSVTPDGSFAVSFFGGMIWSFIDTALLLAIPFLLVIVFKKKTTLPSLEKFPTPSVSVITKVVLCVGIISFLLNENIIPRIGALVSVPKFVCNFGTKSTLKADCLNHASGTKKTEGTAEEVIEINDSKLKISELGGKAVFYTTKFVYFDGHEYEDKRIEQFFALVNGKFAYIATDFGDTSSSDDDRQWVVYEGKKYGEEYTYISDIIDVGGKLGFTGTVVRDRKNLDLNERYVVVDGTRYGKEGAMSGNLVSIGKSGFAYATTYRGIEKTSAGKPKKYNTVTWNNRIIYGPSEEKVVRIYDAEGIPVIVTTDGSVYMESGQIARQYPKRGGINVSQFVIQGNRFAFVVGDDSQKKVYSFGKVFGKGYKNIIGPFLSKGDVYFAGINGDGTTDIVMNDRVVQTYPDPVSFMDVSDEGKIVLLTTSKEGGLKTGKIYFDGALFPYLPSSSEPCRFVHSKLFCGIQVEGMSANYFEGKVFAYKYLNMAPMYIDGAYVFQGMEGGSGHNSTFILGNPSWLEKYKELSKKKD